MDRHSPPASHSTPRKVQRLNRSGVWVEEDSEVDILRRNPTQGFLNESSILTRMSFASLQIAECKPRDGEDEIDRKTFEQWRDVLESGMNIVGIADESTKSSVFRMKAGPELIDVLDNTSAAGAPDVHIFPYDHIMFRLNGFFSSRDFTVLQRQKLRAMTQAPGEASIKYVKRLVVAAKQCGYSKEQTAEVVADIVQTRAHVEDVRKIGWKVSMKGGTLQELIDKVQALKVLNQNEEIYASTFQPPKPAAEVAAVAYKSPQSTHGYGRGFYQSNRGRGGAFRGRGGYFQAGTGNKFAAPCWRCSSPYHRPENCHAIRKKCHTCNKEGHIERACPDASKFKRKADGDLQAGRTKRISAISAEREPPRNENEEPARIAMPLSSAPEVDSNIYPLNSSYLDTTNEFRLINENHALVAIIGDREGNVVTVTGQVAWVPVEFIVDSGADVNTVGGEILDRIMDNDPLQSPIYSLKKGSDRPLVAYAMTGSIEVSATFVAELFITPDRPRLMEKFYVIQGAKALLGRGTATRYSVLQVGLEVPVRGKQQFTTDRLLPGEVFAVTAPEQFPKFNVAPIHLSYDKSLPPSRIVYTSIPPAFREETERRLDELLESGIVERVTDEMEKTFCSSLLVVPKGNSDIRLVVDLRGVNRCIVRSPFKMPSLEAILSELHGATWFSTIDLSSAFFHIVLHENSRHLTNFFAGNGMYRFVRLPFGLCNAPDYFQEILQTIVLADCQGVLNYLDDILVFGRSKQEHDRNLELTLLRLQEHNVRLNNSKCQFCKQEVKFLGFRLTSNGWSVEDDKRKAIENFRRPETLAEVKSFLGLINFAERFIINRADKTERLRALTKSEEFYWTIEEEQEFTLLKSEALGAIIKLGYFDHRDRTELYTDASQVGIGAVLVQFSTSGVARIIACASKSLTLAEQRYPQTHREALAIVWGIERFTLYLTSKQFTVRTDSEANEYIFGGLHRVGKRGISRAEAYALRLLPYRFSIERIPGNLNIADALSRLINSSQTDEPFDENNDRHMLYLLDAGSISISLAEVQAESEKDEELEGVRCGIKSGKWPNDLKRYEAQAKNLRMLDPLVFKGELIVLPQCLRKRAIRTAHEGHIGCGGTKRILREFFWWPNMAKEAEAFVLKCETCIVISRRNPPVPLISRRLPEGPWQVLQVDFLTIPACGSGHLLVCVDTYSRYLHVVVMNQTDARATNAALCRIFEIWGLPLILQSDNGPPFQSGEFIQYWEAKGVRVDKSIPLSAQSNGAVERQNPGIIKAMAAAKEEKRSWKEALAEYAHVHNTRKHHARLGVTPFELMVGWRYRGTFPSLWDRKEPVDRIAVEETDTYSKLVSKKFTDKHRGAKESDVAVGDKVIIAVTQRIKTDPTFSKESYTVIARDGPKVVARNDRGALLTRNVQDVKKVPLGSRWYPDNEVSDEDTCTQSDQGSIEAETPGVDAENSLSQPDGGSSHRSSGVPVVDTNMIGPSSCTSRDKVEADGTSTRRPRREIRKPSRLNDMFLYRIFH